MCKIREGVNERKNYYISMQQGGSMKTEESEPQAEPVEPKDDAKQKSGNKFTTNDQGEHGYDNDGPFGIGMIKGK